VEGGRAAGARQQGSKARQRAGKEEREERLAWPAFCKFTESADC